MQQRSAKRSVDRPIYSSIDTDAGVHHFRLPRPSVVARLLMLISRSAEFDLKPVEDLSAVDDRYLLGAELAEDAVGAVIGTMWAHVDVDLSTKRSAFDRGQDGLREYGDAVLEELHEEGYSTAVIKQITDCTVSALMSSHVPPDAEVSERVDFTVQTRA